MNLVFNSQAPPGGTQRILLGDASQGVPAAMLQSADNRQCIAVYITVEGSPIRFTLGNIAPTQGVAGVGHLLAVDANIRLTSSAVVRTLQMIASVNGVASVVQITPEYERF